MPKKAALQGKIQTVLGTIAPETLGITLTHEHIICNGTCWYTEPEGASDRAMSLRPVSTDFLWWLRYHFFQNRDDMVLDDEATAIAETLRFKLAGGGAICEVSNHGLARDPLALARVSRATGLHIVMGSGYYLRESLPECFADMTEKEITAQIVRDITEGVDDTGVRAGLIGEIGCSYPLDEREIKSLRAAARAQQLTGANLNFHPGQGEDSAREAMDVLEAAGADPRRITVSHIDRAVRERKNRLALARRGATLEYDLFGREGYYPIHKRVVDMPNDATRINEIRDLIEAGFIKQLFVSHDIWNKTQLTRYGGWGYDHILRDVVPVMLAKGMTREEINTIMIDNPRRALTFI